jgi:hypothetical protein
MTPASHPNHRAPAARVDKDPGMFLRAPSLSLEQKLSCGALLSLKREFCPWAGICAVTAYKEISEGRLRIVKVGRKTLVAAADALVWRDRMRGVA